MKLPIEPPQNTVQTSFKPLQNSSADPQEIAKFSALSDKWWDASGPFKPLHKFNPIRLKYIRNTIFSHFQKTSLEGLDIIDIGCGGGLISEPLSRLGAMVTGIDLSEKNISAAQIHAENEGISIDYKVASAEEMALENKRFDVALALEIIEHVADIESFLQACQTLVKPGGLLIITTLNRTAKSFLLGIAGAEYILRWLPQGTHDWRRFMLPSEIVLHIDIKMFHVKHLQGFSYNLLMDKWKLAEDVGVNYMLVLEKTI